MAQLTVDLSADKATLARIAQLILQFAGYEPPAAAQGVLYGDQYAAAQGGQPAASGGSLLNPHAHLDQGQQHTLDVVARAAAEHAAGGTFYVDPSEVFSPPAPPLTTVSEDTSYLDKLVLEPAAPPVPPPPPPAGIDVDLRGLPWDPRIHASTRAKTAEGNWRQKRNVDPELMTKVEAELRQTMGAPVPRVPAPPVVVPPPPFAGNAAPPAPPLPSGIPSVPASAGAATGASRGDVGPAPTFPQLMQAITRAFTVDKTLTRPQVDAAVTKVGLASLPMLASRPDLVGAVATELGLAL